MELLTLEEVTKKYKIKPQMVYSMVREGRIPYTKTGRLLRFPLELLNKWQEAHTFIPKSMGR
jgi:excisionase family DNA binding protein